MKFIITTVLLACLLTSCVNDLNTVEAFKERSKYEAGRGKNVTIYYKDSAEVKVKLTAPLLLQYESNNNTIEMPEGFVLYFYDGDVEESRLSGKYGIIYQDENKMFARDSIVGINNRGERLYTEEMTWKEEDGKIFSNKFVKIVTEGQVLYGKGFEAMQDFSRYKIWDLQGTIDLNEEDENL